MPSLNFRLPSTFLTVRSTCSAEISALGSDRVRGEGHALLALAQVCAAVDIEQLDLGDEGACLLDGVLDLAAGDLFLADKGQVTLDGG